MHPQEITLFLSYHRSCRWVIECGTTIVKTDPEKLTKKHNKLVHSDMMKVISHVQREAGEWIVNTLMVEGCEVPFKYKRKKLYKNLKGQRVNLTYYPDVETVAGLEFEVMSVVRIKVA